MIIVFTIGSDSTAYIYMSVETRRPNLTLPVIPLSLKDGTFNVQITSLDAITPLVDAAKHDKSTFVARIEEGIPVFSQLDPYAHTKTSTLFFRDITSPIVDGWKNGIPLLSNNLPLRVSEVPQGDDSLFCGYQRGIPILRPVVTDGLDNIKTKEFPNNPTAERYHRPVLNTKEFEHLKDFSVTYNPDTQKYSIYATGVRYGDPTCLNVLFESDDLVGKWNYIGEVNVHGVDGEDVCAPGVIYYKGEYWMAVQTCFTGPGGSVELCRSKNGLDFEKVRTIAQGIHGTNRAAVYDANLSVIQRKNSVGEMEEVLACTVSGYKESIDIRSFDQSQTLLPKQAYNGRVYMCYAEEDMPDGQWSGLIEILKEEDLAPHHIPTTRPVLPSSRVTPEWIGGEGYNLEYAGDKSGTMYAVVQHFEERNGSLAWGPLIVEYDLNKLFAPYREKYGEDPQYMSCGVYFPWGAWRQREFVALGSSVNNMKPFAQIEGPRHGDMTGHGCLVFPPSLSKQKLALVA